MSKKYPSKKVGIGLLIAGCACLIISLSINIIFIKSTDFKSQFRKKQYEQCIYNNEPSVCNKKFPNT